MMGFGGFGGFGMFGMMFFWVVVVVAAIFFVSHLFPGVSNNARGGQGQMTSTAALDILKQRYARGEISKAEYEDMRHSLQP